MPKGRYFIRENVYICGAYMDTEIYPVFGLSGKRRGRCKPTSEIQEKINQRNAEKKLVRLVHTNFTEKDIALHLTHREHVTAEEARRALQNYLRRVKRAWKERGLPALKYISCTEFGGEGGRVHHHLIVNGGLSRDELEELWGLGYANSKRLQFGEEGVAALTHYMAKSHEFYKRWNASRNLIKPEPITRDGVIGRRETEEMVRAIDEKRAAVYFEERYPDFVFTDADFSENLVNRGLYITLEMRRVKAADSRRKREEGQCFDSGRGRT